MRPAADPGRGGPALARTAALMYTSRSGRIDMTRRTFIAAGLGMALAAGMPAQAAQVPPRKRKLAAFKPLALRRIAIEAGASAPFKAIHLSDTHIARADVSDRDPRKTALAAERSRHFPFGEHYLAEAVFAARRDKALLLHTGDMVDFVSNANLAIAERYFGSGDWFACAGNHEFSKYVGEAREDAAYKADSMERVSSALPCDPSFASRVVEGVNFVAADDVYYNFTAEQLDKMEKEVAKGLPIVFMCHVPLFTPKLYDAQMRATKGACAYLAGVPDGKIATWRAPAKPFAKGEEWRDRRVQQRTDAATSEFIAYLKAQPLVKAVLAGHLHSFWQERFSPTAVQHICPATYKGEGLAIDFA